MRSISCGDFLMITARLRGAASRSWRGCGRAPRSGCGCRRSVAAGPAPRSTRPAARSGRGRRPGACGRCSSRSSSRWISREPSWSQTLVALGRVGVDVVDVAGLHAHAPAGERGGRSRRRAPRCSSTAVSLRSRRPMASLERLGLADAAREAVEQEAVRAASPSTHSRITPMMTSSGTRSPLSMYSLAFWPSSVPLAHRLAQDVAGGDVGQVEVLAAGARPGCPCPRRAGREG